MIAALLNGVAIDPERQAIHLDDRGMLYGDGVFETMLAQHGNVRFVDDHFQRLQDSCKRLNISIPDIAVLHIDLQQLTRPHPDAVVKLIVTRGRGSRGYRPSKGEATRIWQVFASPTSSSSGIALRWCTTRLARNEQFAGMKHLNKLEQVMAQSEWYDSHIAEGLMLDTEGELVCGTMSNIFMVIDDALITPDLRFCGVQGIMRKNVLRIASELNIAVEMRSVRPEELLGASEVFVTNAVRGIQPVQEILPSH